MNTFALPIRAQGAPEHEIEAKVLGPITFEDLPKALQRTTPIKTIDKLRTAHHHIALLLAAGKTYAEIMRLTGSSHSRIWHLQQSPMFQELVEEKRKAIIAGCEVVILDNTAMAVQAQTLALSALNERLEDEPDKFTNQQLLSIFAETGDRVGPMKGQLNVNANLDFAERLAAARKNMFGGDPKMIESPPLAGGPSLERDRADRPLAGECQ